jgi:hypothetical protein
MHWMEERVGKKLEMKRTACAVNIRQKMGIVKALKLKLMIEMMNSVRLVKVN